MEKLYPQLFKAGLIICLVSACYMPALSKSYGHNHFSKKENSLKTTKTEQNLKEHLQKQPKADSIDIRQKKSLNKTASHCFEIIPNNGGGNKRASNCESEDGSFKIAMSPSSAFTYMWLNSDGQVVEDKRDFLQNVNPGTYTVVVTRKSDGCQEERTFIVPSNDPVPAIATTPTHVTTCSGEGSTGSITVTLSGGLNTKTYKLNLHEGSGSGPSMHSFEITGNNTLTINYPITFNAGDSDRKTYTVKIDDPLLCARSEGAATILDLRSLPNLTLVNQSNNTSCTDPNGEISVSAFSSHEEPVGGYAYEWFEGGSTLVSTGQTTSTLTEAEGGSYTVRAINNDSRCEVIQTYNISDNLVYPVANPQVISHFNNCANPNGAVTATASTPSPPPGHVDDYTYEWTNENGDIIAPEDLNSLVGGNFSVVATNTLTGCSSLPVTVQVNDNTSIPDIIPDTEIPQTSCDDNNPNGGLSIMPNSGNYSYQWHQGSGTSNPITGQTSSSIANQPTGTYTVWVRDENTQCINTAELIISEYRIQPEVTPASTSLTTCSPANGSVSATASTAAPGIDPDGYSFAWTNADGDPVDPSVLSNLEAGVYNVIATNNTTLCVSDPVSIQVMDETILPEILLSEELVQTSCDASNPNGGLTINAGSGNFTYEWHIGEETNSLMPGQTSPGLTGQEAGTYTVLVRNNDTGCEAFSSFIITENLVRPQVDFTTTDFTNCTPPNGSISATAFTTAPGTEPAAGYTYVWTNQNGDPVDNNDLNTLTAGIYTVVITNNTTTCVSDPVSIQVNDATVLPDISLVQEQPQTSCNTNYNGGLSISPSTGNYSYSWYRGAGTTTPLSAQTSASIANQQADTYTVVVQNNDTGCENLASFIITEILVKPIVTPNVVSHLTHCTVPNGSVSATANTPAPGTEPGDGYTFVWTDNVGDPIDANNLNQLEEGLYTVIATNNTTNCISDPVNIEIDDESVLPEIALVEEQPQTSCNTSKNGGLTLNIVGDNLEIQWYIGAGTTTPLSGATQESIVNQPAGVYTVWARDAQSNCEGIASFHITENLVKPQVTLTLERAHTHCTNPNGEISATVVTPAPGHEPSNGYSYAWTNQAGQAIAPEDTDNLSFGSYTLVVTNNATNCVSDPVSRTVPDQRIRPAITITENNKQTSCKDPNGSLSASATTPAPGTEPGGYIFAWFEGSNTSGTSVNNNAHTVNDLDAGYYTVRATNNETQCTNTRSYFLEEELLYPEISANPVDITTCTSWDGFIEANLIGAGGPAPQGVSFIWHYGQNTNNPPVATTQDNNPNLNASTFGQDVYAGYYTIVGENNFTGCQSEPVTVFLAPPTPPFTIDAEINAISVSCEENSGVVSANVPDPGTYTYEWYVGRPIETNPPSGFYTNPPLEFDPNTPLPVINPGGNIAPDNLPPHTTGTTYNPVTSTQGQTLYGYSPGTYTVVVTNAQGCKAKETIYIPYQDMYEIEILRAPENSTSCIIPNGSIEVRIDPATFTEPDIGQTDFRFRLYKGNIPDGFMMERQGNDPGTIFDGLDRGNYAIIAIEDITGLNCPSPPVYFVIEDKPQNPVITTNNVTHNNFCVGGNGAITVTASAADIDDDISQGFNFQWWYNGKAETETPDADNNALVAPFTNEQSNLTHGSFKVRVTNNESGCFSTKNITVNHRPEIPEIQDADVTPATACNFDGGVLLQNGYITPGPGNTADYAFTWYEDNAEPESIIAGINTNVLDGNNYADMTPGTYYLTATKNIGTGSGEGCTSTPFEVYIEDLTANPEFSFAYKNNNHCDTNTPDGSLRVENIITPAPGSAPGSGYSFEWYEGPLPLSGSIIGTGNEITNFASATYSVKVTNNDTGCETVASASIGEHLVYPVVTASVIQHKTLCGSDNGRAQATVDANTTSPSFAWFEGQTASGPVLGTNNIIENLAAIHYAVEATNTLTACPSLPVTIRINNRTVLPTGTFTSQADNACTGGPSNGQLTVTASITDPNFTNANYSYEWFNDQNNSIGAALNTGNTHTINNRAAGSYSVNIRNEGNQCSATAYFSIPKQEIYPIVSATVNQHKTLCQTDNGQATATVDNNTLTPAYNWYDGQNGLGNIIATSAIANTLAAQYYSVTATNNFNCISAPANIQILDRTVIPALVFSAIADNACSGGPYNGQLQVTASMSDPNFANANWSYEWFNDQNVSIASQSNTGNTHSILNRVAETYAVEVRNEGNQCAITGYFSIPKQEIYPIVSAQINQHKTLCNTHNGRATASVDGATITPSYNWYAGTTASGSPISTTAIANNLDAQFYTVTATNSFNCVSAPATIQILNRAEIPFVVMATTPDNYCSGGANGSLLATPSMNSGNEPNSGYSFAWYQGSGTASIIAGQTQPTLNNRSGIANFTVRVTNNDTGCATDVTSTVGKNNIYPIAFAAITNHKTHCTIDNGGALANADQATANPAFTWYSGASDSGPMLGNNAPIQNLAIGHYTVVVTNNFNCNSTPKTIEILDRTVKPIINLETQANNHCINTAFNGSFTATAFTGGQVSDAGYQWTYNGNTFNGDAFTRTELHNNNNFQYQVAVRDLQNDCSFISPQFTIENIPLVPILVNYTTEPQTNCGASIFDGSITISDFFPSSVADYSFTWRGPDRNIIAGNGAQLTNRQAGTYYVIAQRNDNADGPGRGCVSTEYQIEIQENLNLPNVVITKLSDQTMCNGTFNGALSATANGSTDSRYTFTWSGPGNPPATPAINGLRDGEFSLTVFDDDTQCETTRNIFVNHDRSVRPINVAIDQNTLCIGGNGRMQASINDVVENYAFEWKLGYVGEAPYTLSEIPQEKIVNQYTIHNLTEAYYTVIVTDLIRMCTDSSAHYLFNDVFIAPQPQVYDLKAQTHCFNPDGAARVRLIDEEENEITADYTFTWYNDNNFHFTGTRNDTLRAETYFIFGVNNQTACHSDTLVFQIEDRKEVIDFNILVKNATCTAPIGSAEVKISSGSVSVNVFWTDEHGANLTSGFKAENLSAGIYYAHVIADNGCEKTKQAKVDIDMVAFQGISVDGDGINDYFEISCIERYPINNVKIFNRAGTLVFERDNYDNNESTAFAGLGNKGVYAGGRKLPEGTYFYIIDKKNGQKPQAGFIELVR
jgi:hypothetical protein